MLKKKKLLIAIAIFLCAALIITGVGISAGKTAALKKQQQQQLQREQQQELYQQAVEELKNQPLKLDGSNETTDALITAVQNADYTEPKNIILMIGDGMGFNAVEAAQRVYADKLLNGTLAMNTLPVQGAQSTYSASSSVTDSAAGATALATGYKTSNKVVAMDYMAANNYTTVLELAAEKGMATGVVTTDNMCDATPAVFTAHTGKRKNQPEITKMQLEKLADGTLDLVLAGGYGYYESDAHAQQLAAAIDAGVTYSRSWQDISKAELPMCGLFSEAYMDSAVESQPTIMDMTDLALNTLDTCEEGFFLMVESAHIDTFGEEQNYERLVKEVYLFDCAVAIAMRYVALNPDTVLIVTADHETGGLWIPPEATASNTMEHRFANGQHSSRDVPLLAAGYGTEELKGNHENTDVGIFMAKLLGETDFGQTSEVFTKKNGNKKVTFSAENSTYVIPQKNIPKLPESGNGVTVFRVTMENKGDAVAALPEINFTNKNRSYDNKAQVDYIDAGETLVVSYVVPIAIRSGNNFGKITEISLVLEEDSQLFISDIQVVTRVLSK